VRTVFLGTSRFAAAVLESLASEGVDEGAGHGTYCPALILTRPDRPAGRGRKLSSPPVAEAARALGLEVAQPESVNDEATRALVASVAPEAVLVCAFGALIREPLLSDFQMLNVHPSLLPRWRGAAPVERAIMAGDEHTGVSIMRLTAGLDSGPVCLAEREPILQNDTYGSLAERLAALGGRLLLQALDTLQAGAPLEFAEQDERLVTYAEKIGPGDRLLDQSSPAAELELAVRALSPHIGARVGLSDGTLLGVKRAVLADAGTPAGEEVSAGAGTPAEAGVYASGERLLLACAPGVLELLVVQPPGKQPMDAAAFLRGHGLPGA
jgi:methionyl-tRNA formyltransferase